MADIADIAYKDEGEYFEQAVKRTINKPRLWNPETEGFYNDEGEFLQEQVASELYR